MTTSVRFVYQVVVPKSVAPKELLQVYEASEMTVLPPWDPMVCLLTIFSLGLVLNPCWHLGGFGMTIHLLQRHVIRPLVPSLYSFSWKSAVVFCTKFLCCRVSSSPAVCIPNTSRSSGWIAWQFLGFTDFSVVSCLPPMRQSRSVCYVRDICRNSTLLNPLLVLWWDGNGVAASGEMAQFHAWVTNHKKPSFGWQLLEQCQSTAKTRQPLEEIVCAIQSMARLKTY